MPGCWRRSSSARSSGDCCAVRRAPPYGEIGLADSSLSHVARVIRWIRDHYTEPFRVEELAAMAGMSTSAFHRHFRTVTAMTPIQFQKKIRLQEARLRLVGLGEDVTSAGYAVGYDSPSQFSREYRREFGTPPSRDAGRLRAEAYHMPAFPNRAGSCKWPRAMIYANSPVSTRVLDRYLFKTS